MKRPLFVLACYVIITFAWAYTWNLVLFHDLYVSLTAGMLRETPIFALGFLTMFLQAVALYGLFHKFYAGGSPIQEGLMLGLLVGIFDIGYASLVVPAKFSIAPVWQYTGLEATYGLVHFAVSGIVVAFIFEKVT